MICISCGKDIGESLVCPYCGKEIEAKEIETKETEAIEVKETEVKETEVKELTDASEELSALDIPEAKELTEVKESIDKFSFGIKAPDKKKRKWPKVLGILFILAVLVGTIIYFTYPLISPLIDPKEYAVSALKKSASDIEAKLISAIENIDVSSVGKPREQTASVQLDTLMLNDKNMLSEFDERNASVKIQSSAQDGVVSGTITIGKSSKDNVEIEFYMDSSIMKFRIPALTSQAFSLSMDDMKYNSAFSYDSIYSIAGSLDSEQLQKLISNNKGLVIAAIRDVFNGIDVLIEESEYERIGTQTYSSENGDKKSTVYEIKVTENALKKCAKAIVTNVFSDSELTQYASILTLATGKTKQNLISSIESANLNINIPVKVYFNKDRKIIKSDYDLTEAGAYFGIARNDFKVSSESIGNDNIEDYMIFNVSLDGATLKSTAKRSDSGKFYYSSEFKTSDLWSKLGDFINFSMEGENEISGSDLKASLDKVNLSGSINGESFDIRFSSEIASTVIPVMTENGSDLTNALDLESMTNAKKKAVLTEVSGNLKNLKGKISNKWIEMIQSYINDQLAAIK